MWRVEKVWEVEEKKVYLFAECQKNNTRQSFVRRVSEKNTRQTSKLPSIFFLLSVFCATLGKKVVCRVPDKWHSANSLTLGDYGLSRSDARLAATRCITNKMFDSWLANFYNDWKKIIVVHLTESYGGQGMKYLKVHRLKYLLVQKCGTKYQKVGSNTNLIYFF